MPPADTSKLSALNERFSGFERQMDMDTRARKDAEDSMLNSLKDTVTRLEQTLNTETKRRVESNKALQCMFESQMCTVQDKLEAIFLERFETLQSSVDNLNDRMASVERDFMQARELYIRDIEDKSAMVAKDVDSLKMSFAGELSDRKERETLIAAKLRDLEAHTAERFLQDRTLCNQKYAILHEELEESRGVREENDRRFQDYIIEEVSALKHGLV
jgi:hypothetical protein